MGSGTLNFEDILLCEPRFMDPAQGGLWWCETPEDVKTVTINAVCLAGLAKWEQVQYCKGWISAYKYVFVASKHKDFIDRVRQHVPWIPILAPVPEAFGEYETVTELCAGVGLAALERHLMCRAVMQPSSGLLNLADVTHRDLSGISRTLSGFKTLDRAIGGFRDGEMTVWTGKRGEGKSTVLGQVLLEAIDQGHRVCAYSGELVADRFKSWLMAQAAGPDHLERYSDPATGGMLYSTPADIAGKIDLWWDRKFYLYDVGISSAHDETSIMNEFEYAQWCLGCDVFLVDNIMTVRLNGDRDFYRAQSLFAQKLAQFSKGRNVHVHMVAHPRKTERGKPVEDSDDVSGTGDITNIADNVISVRRLPVPGGEDGRDAELGVLKAREAGMWGKIGLMFDRPSKRFYEPCGSPHKKFGWEFIGQKQFEVIGETA